MGGVSDADDAPPNRLGSKANRRRRRLPHLDNYNTLPSMITPIFFARAVSDGWK